MDAQGCLIVFATRLHIGPHVAHMAPSDRAEIERVVGAPRRFLRGLLAQSSYARAAMLDGVPAAIWGMTGTLASSSGHVWLSATPEARARPSLFARVARAEVMAMLAHKAELRTTVAANDRTVLRFLRFLGFEIGSVIPVVGGVTLRVAVLKKHDTAVHYLQSASLANGVVVGVALLSEVDLSPSSGDHDAVDGRRSGVLSPAMHGSSGNGSLAGMADSAPSFP